jgi:adenosylcobinamide kinase/adenosylcobinamide-phosphate guanylyltransferase
MGKPEIILVLGGARSGKSSFAEKIALESGREVIYVATSEVKDEEMALRVKKHRERRPGHWYTLEEPLDPEVKLKDIAGPSSLIILDCLTLWVSNLLLHPEIPFAGAGSEEKEEYIAGKVNSLLTFLYRQSNGAILVSNETGWGIVPGNPLTRAYRDIAGRVNRECAERASKVYLTVAGLPVELKSLAVAPEAIMKGEEYDS